MVTIKKIEIKDYFGKGNFEWNLDPVVNILGGKNGSGKSSLFKLCYTLLTTERINEEMDKHFSTLFEKVVITLSNDWTVTWTRAKENEHYSVDIGGKKPLVFRESVEIYDNKRDKRVFSELSSQFNVFMINSFEQHTATAAQYERQPKSLPLDDPTMLDLMIKDQIDLRNKDFSKVMEDFVDSPEEDEQKRAEYVKSYKKIYSILAHFLQEYDEPFKSSFEFTKDGSAIGFERLSMGEKQILLLLLMVSNTNQKPCIFFMDEPDLSMHIDWKEILVKELHDLNPYMQIILSTHAPSVITGWHDKVKEVSHLIKK
ncbi:AAA family ATPase [Xylanibacter ruminicola]|uniref:Predicted ATP-binding protein involved in virulence n=1 Tax=Xylanibacter ruminicola TaxID=839 RepID=A0A1M6UG01_XYLRU|nr:AAA family ATPase [Xylanibacter ruminicola]SHK68099.1 Predicted ATP-binding protein involved in virulence [Xylanibacter ruminicola]